METRRLRANIGKLYALKIVRNFMLLMPVMVLFLQDLGLTLSQVFVSQTLFALVTIVLEVPSGYIADRYGMRFSLLIGALCAWLGVSMYALSFDFVSVLIAESFLGISAAFISGSDSALLYETLEALGTREAYTSYSSRLFAFETGSEAVAAVMGGFLALVSLRTPILLQTPIMFLLIPLAWSLYEPAYMRAHKTILASGTALTTMWRTFAGVMHTNKALKWLVLYGAVIDTAGLISVWFRQPYFVSAGISIMYFGFIWAALMIATTASSLFAGTYERLLGKYWALVSFVVLSIGSYVLLGAQTSIMCALGFLVFCVVRGLKEPLLQGYVHALADSTVRATVLSIKGFISRLLFAFAGPFLGWFADVYTLQQTFFACAILFGALGAVTVFMLARHKALVI